MELLMLFTVFTPTFNRRHTLLRLFESLEAQTFRDFEWLVIDDGSTDGTGELLHELESRASFSLRYHYQPNAGKHVASNRAVDLASGLLFTTLDSDDALLPHSLRRMADHWWSIPLDRRHEFSGVTCLCQRQDGTILGDCFPASASAKGVLDSDPIAMMVFGITGDKWGFHATDIMRQYRFPEFEGERFIPEGLVWNRIGSKYGIRYVNEPLRRVYFDERDCLSRRSVEIRSRSPRGAQLFYLEQSRFAPTALLKYKALINYIRFSLHGHLSIAINLGTLALLPAGLALWLRDRGKQARAAVSAGRS
jgi:glycosyltransferase involved in cell wall biosynthesis